MTLDHFLVFAAVAKRQNVTRAAQELRISQPAVTKHLRLLEESYNAKLYTRGGKGIELTDAGRMFIRYVRTTLKQHDRFKQKLHEAMSRAKADCLTVGGSYSPSASFLPSVLATFKKSHPHIQLNLETDNKAAMEQRVVNSKVDIAVINNAPSNHSLTMEPYRQETLVAFASKNHPLARKRELTWQDLERVPLLIRKSAGGRDVTEQFLQSVKKKGVKPNIAMRCDSPEAVKAFVKRKMGAGILFKETVEPEVRKGEFKIIKLPGQTFEGQSFIVYRKDRPLSPNARELLELLRQSQRKK